MCWAARRSRSRSSTSVRPPRTRQQFIATSVALENTGVSAYSGQALNIADPDVVACGAFDRHGRSAARLGDRPDPERDVPKGIAPDGPFDKALSAKKVLKAVEDTGFIVWLSEPARCDPAEFTAGSRSKR